MTPHALVLTLHDGKVVTIPWNQCSEKLAKADVTQRQYLELSPGGNGIHWPLIDEDLSVVGLVHSCTQSAS